MKSTLLVATVLATALTSAAALPAFAAKNTGAFQKSIEYDRTGGPCTAYQGHFSDNLAKMNSAKTREDRVRYRDEVNWAIERGIDSGCAWVNWV